MVSNPGLQRRFLENNVSQKTAEGKIWFMEVDTFSLAGAAVKRLRLTTGPGIINIASFNVDTTCDELTIVLNEGGTSSSGSDILSEVINTNRALASVVTQPLSLYEEDNGVITGGLELISAIVLNPESAGKRSNVGGLQRDLNFVLIPNTTYNLLFTNTGTPTGKTHVDIIYVEA